VQYHATTKGLQIGVPASKQQIASVPLSELTELLTLPPKGEILALLSACSLACLLACLLLCFE